MNNFVPLISLSLLWVFPMLAKPARPNVLFLMSDDLNTALSGFGHPQCKTPQLDKLASRGMRFENMHCQYPVCGSSRASLMSGLYPYTNGHLMISPYSHTSDTNDLSSNCNQEIMHLANESMKILKNKMNAEGFNFGANLGKAGGAGIEDHLHYHIVPRWNGDTNFMPVVGTTKVMVEGLNETWVSLKHEFDAIKDI